MRFRLSVAAVFALALPLDAAMVPGEPAPDLVVKDSAGAAVRLSAWRDKKDIALLSPAAGQPPADLAAASRLLAPLDTILLVADGPARTVLIDRTGTVRRVTEGRALVGAELAKFVELWRDGKSAFVAYCARCHGEYGDAIWCDPNPLTGVGRRLSLEQILEILHPVPMNDEVLVRSERIKKLDLETILIYLRSL